MEQHLEAFERALLRRNFRPNSITPYLRAVARFLDETALPLDALTRDHVVAHLDRTTAQGFAPRTRNQAAAALRIFFHEVAQDPKMTSGLRRALVPSHVPVVLSGTDVQALLAACRTPTHRALLMTLYAAGLRVSEACCLRIEDLDSRRMVIHLVQSKTGARYAPLSPTLLTALRAHYRFAQPKGPWLFPGRSKTKPVTRAAVRQGLRAQASTP